MASSRPATKRRRDAAAELRSLAAEVNVGDRGRNADLNTVDFGNLYISILAFCATPEQRTRAAAARELYDGTGASVALPSVPKLRPVPGKSAPAPWLQAPLATQLWMQASPMLNSLHGRQMTNPQQTQPEKYKNSAL